MGISLKRFILFIVIEIQFTCLAASKCNNTENEEKDGLPSMLVRLNNLELENQLQKDRTEHLEFRVENYENTMKMLEEKLMQQPKENANKFKINEFGYSSNIIAEQSEVPSSTSRINATIESRIFNRDKRPVRLLPNKIFKNEPKENESDGEKYPSNCEDLNEIGYTLNGFYMVKRKLADNNNSAKLQTVFCNFKNAIPYSSTPQVKETSIGYLDIKTIREGVHFYVHKSCSSSNLNGVVRFDLVDLNLGRGYSASSGVFTVPKSGVYQFSFIALKEQIDPLSGQSSSFLVIFLRVNGIRKGVTFSVYGFTPNPVSLHSTLKLNMGDKIDLYKTTGKINCNDQELSSHFVGSLLEEDLNI